MPHTKYTCARCGAVRHYSRGRRPLVCLDCRLADPAYLRLTEGAA